MTQQEILNHNKLCAEFLGYKCSVNEQYELPNMMTFPPKKNSNLCHTAKVCCVKDMQFHSDWNWIMEVVEAIKEKTKFKTIDECSEDEWYATIGVTRLTITSTKEAVVQAINEFLIWYNQNKQS